MKKLKYIVGVVAVFAVVCVNVWNAATSLKGSELNVEDVDAMANPEGMGGYTGRYWEEDVDSIRLLSSNSHYDGNVTVLESVFEGKVVCVPYSYGKDHCNLGDNGIRQTRKTMRALNTGPGMWQFEECREESNPGYDFYTHTSDNWGKTGW